MTKYERIVTAIPVASKWDLSDIEVRAAELGIDKNEFVIKAVDLLMNFDNDFLNYIKYFAEGMKLPEYLVIQNMIFFRKLDEEAQNEVFGSSTKMVEGFMSVTDEKGTRALTGKELEKHLKPMKIKQYKAQLEENEDRLESLRKMVETD